MSDLRYCRPLLYSTSVVEERVPELRPYEGSVAALQRHQREWLSDGYLRDLRESFRSHLGFEFSGSVLEVGCGMSHHRETLTIPSDRYVGVDLNRRFIEAGRVAFPGARLVRADAGQLPFASASFDCVLCSDVLIHLEDMRPALREIVRVTRGPVLLRLRSGNGGAQGSKMVYDPVRQRLFSKIEIGGEVCYFFYNVLAPEDLSTLLAEVGVKDYKVEDLLPPEHERMGLTMVFFDTRTC